MTSRRIVACRSTPLVGKELEKARALAREIASKELRGEQLPVMFPTDAYAVFFERRADSILDASIQTLLANMRQRVASGRLDDTPGVIYAFWITGEPTDHIKIGRSAQTPQQRMADWNRSIAGRGASSRQEQVVNQMHARRTRFNILAESLVHTTLTCEHLGQLRHPTTGSALTEFYRIQNIMALRLFMAVCARYADVKGDEIVQTTTINTSKKKRT